MEKQSGIIKQVGYFQKTIHVSEKEIVNVQKELAASRKCWIYLKEGGYYIQKIQLFWIYYQLKIFSKNVKQN